MATRTPADSRHCGRSPTCTPVTPGNKPVTESLHPSSPDDWLIVAGDVAERTDEIRWSLDLLRRRFAKVIWVPGNHELWTTTRDPVQIFGRARYDYLVNMCDEMGVVTPEHPFPVWTERGGPATIVPMFLLYDYSFLPQGATTKAEGLAIARDRNVVATDEFLLSHEPYPTREAWCRERLACTRARLEQLDWMTPTVLVNHFPMVREPCDALVLPGILAVVRNHRDRRLAHPLQRGLLGLRAPAHSADHLVRRRALRGGVGGLSARVAAPQASHAGCARCCRTRSTRPATSTNSAATSRSPLRCGPVREVPGTDRAAAI